MSLSRVSGSERGLDGRSAVGKDGSVLGLYRIHQSAERIFTYYLFNYPSETLPIDSVG